MISVFDALQRMNDLPQPCRACAPALRAASLHVWPPTAAHRDDALDALDRVLTLLSQWDEAELDAVPDDWADYGGMALQGLSEVAVDWGGIDRARAGDFLREIGYPDQSEAGIAQAVGYWLYLQLLRLVDQLLDWLRQPALRDPVAAARLLDMLLRTQQGLPQTMRLSLPGTIALIGGTESFDAITPAQQAALDPTLADEIAVYRRMARK
ncbi:MAG: hypothetical protein OHK0039_13610 [Bacteroidia bacterium]